MRGLGCRAQVVVVVALVMVFAAAGVASAGGTVNLTWSPSGPFSYGALAPGATASPKVFTLSNSGGTATAALKITLTPSAGTPSAAFKITADTCTGTSLGPNKSCGVTVSYTAPATAQADQAVLAAASNKAATASVTLQGSTAKVTPSISTTAKPASAPAGSPIADTADLEQGSSPAGAITFSLYGPGDSSCSAAVFTQTVTVSGNGTYTSSGYTPAAGGAYQWVASYSGDGNNNPAVTHCGDEPVTITRVTVSVSQTAAPAHTTAGGQLSDQATVSGGDHPAGTVTFNLYGNGGCSGAPLFTDTEPLAGGAATSGAYTVTAVPPGGELAWTASYNGDASNVPATSGCAQGGEGLVTVTQDTPTLQTTPVSGGSNSWTDQADLEQAYNPTGSLEFQLYGPTSPSVPVCDSTDLVADQTQQVNGTGSYSSGPVTIGAGTYEWVVTYSGDTNNTTAISGCGGEPILGKAVPSISSTANPATTNPGHSIADTADLENGSSPTGAITFSLYGPGDSNCSSAVFTQTVTVSGNGTYTSGGYTPATAGTYQWVASYSGDGTNNSAVTNCGDDPVDARYFATVTNSPQQGSTSPGSQVSDQAAVHVSGGTAPATGTVTFYLYGGGCGAGTLLFTDTEPLSGGLATSGDYTVTGVPPGGFLQWTATYSGDASYFPSTQKCMRLNNQALFVQQFSPTLQTTPVSGGSNSWTDQADLEQAYNPTGSLEFQLYGPTSPSVPVCDSTDLVADQTQQVNGTGSYSSGPVTIGAGTYEWVVTYSGDTNNTTAISGCGGEPISGT